MEKEILEKLLNKYYKSNHFKDGGGKKVSINEKCINEIFGGGKSPEDSKKYGGPAPQYNDEDFRMEVNSVLEELQKRKYVKLKTKEEFAIPLYSEVILNLDKQEEIVKKYAIFNEGVHRENVRKILKKYENNEFLKNYIQEQIDKLERYQQIKFSYTFKDGKKISTNEIFDKVLYAATKVFENYKSENAILIRNFSQNIFNDSKALEKMKTSVCTVIKQSLLLNDQNIISKELLNDNKFGDKELLNFFNIAFNPETILFSGSLAIEFANGTIINSSGTGLGIQSNEIQNIKKITVFDDNIYTVENLTTYNYSELNGLKIYIGGFATKMCCELLKKIKQCNFGKRYYHFGDIDAGGFYIFQDLINRTCIEFTEYKMDIESLESKKDSWIELTEHDREKLSCILDDTKSTNFDNLIEYMLKNNCKLEQESFSK